MDLRTLARDGVGVAERTGRRAWRRRIVERGVDVTDRVAAVRCLVLAPHPDDETLGCGATIARKRAAGTPVRVLVAADGRSSHRSALLPPAELAAVRSHEVVEACRILGVEPADVVQLGFEDGSLGQRRSELAAAIAREVDAFEPDEIRLPCRRDWHPDHQDLRTALDLALAGSRHRPRVLEHPVWLWMHGPWDADAGGPWPRRRPVQLLRGYLRPSAWPRAELVQSRGFLQVKHSALLAHRSQTTNLTGEPGWATFDDEFVASFLLPVEVAFPSAPAGATTGAHRAGPSSAASASVT